MANNNFISLTDLDVLALDQSLKNAYSANAFFTDWNFQGSNLSELTRNMSFNSYLLLFYMNMLGSEAFIDSAQLRQAVISKAKELNYIPRSRYSSTAQVNVTINPTDTPSTITIPKYFKFTTTVNGNVYTYTTNETIIVRNNAGYVAANVTIYEGRVVTENFIVGTDERYIISSGNVDTSSITVNIQNSLTDTTNTYFSYASSLIGLTSNSNVFFLQGYSDNQYEIVFGNGTTGSQLQNGNLITVTYRDTAGPDANGAKLFKPVNTILGPNNIVYSSISVATLSSSVGGAERESTDSIKFNAPRSYPTNYHAITENDYETLIRDNFPQIQSVRAIGGQNLPQKLYSRVVIATKPFGGVITPDVIKNEIIDFITQRNVLVVTPIIIDPDYFYVSANVTVNYNTSKTSLTTNDIESLVRASISVFNNTYLNDFGLDFRESKFGAAIDNSDASITSNDTSIRMIKRLAPQFNVPTTFIINFGNALVSSQTPLYAYPTISFPSRLISTFFKYKATNGITYNVQLKDDGLGNINLITPDLGGQTTLVANIGTVNYTTGSVMINNLTASSYASYISLYVTPAIPDINITLNQILIIDQNDVTIQVLSDD